MFEPSAPIEPSPPAPKPPPSASAPVDGRGLSLIDEVRAAQARSLRLQGALYGAAAFLVLFFFGALLANAHPRLGLAVLCLAPLSALSFALVFGVALVRRRVGDADRTARLLATRAPELSLDLLSAVELSRAMGRREDFSPELARAFLRDVDRRAASLPISALVERRPQAIATWTLAGTLLAGAITLGMVAEHVVAGVIAAFARAEPSAIARREPITGDFAIAYRYPDYTGLEPRVVEGSAGDVAGPAGTEVTVTTRADRDVTEAALIVNGARVPLTVEGRKLSGAFLLEATGQYHVAFLDGDDIEVEGPDLPIQLEADAAPTVRLLAPLDTLELDPSTKSVSLQYEATDDFGLSSLELVFKAQGGAEQRLPLERSELRAARGAYGWNVGALALKPGAEVRYFVEAKDGNTVKGAQRGVSKTQVLKLYSAAEHRRDAIRRAEVVWERLVTHLADRQEGADRKTPLTLEALGSGARVDERAALLAASLAELADTLSQEKEPLTELVAALSIIAEELAADTRLITQRRASLKRSAELGSKVGALDGALAFALTSRLSVDLADSEKNVLYLEALLDRARLDAIRALTKQLKEDRRELTRLVEELQKTNDADTKEALLEQMQQLRERMRELQERMNEMAKGLRDEFLNQEAIDLMQMDENSSTTLDEIERLVREGKTDEALKKMQQLSMQLDEMVERLEQGAEAADENADPELSERFGEFASELGDTIAEQDKVANATRALKDKARQAAKERIAQRGAQVKRELFDALQQLERSYSTLPSPPGLRLDEHAKKALQEVRNTQQALQADDFDLAAEAARELAGQAQKLEQLGEDLHRRDRAFQAHDDALKESKRLAERLSADERRADDVARRLEDLFPPANQSLDQAEQQQLKELAKQQRKLGERGQALKQQMRELGERAPIFDEQATEQMDQAAGHLESASDRLSGKDPSQGHGEQQRALQALRSIQQGLEQQQQQQGGGKGKLPMPMRRSGGRGGSPKNSKVEIPDEDPAAQPREFRKDVMDAMKQGAPDRYKEQNKKYYEELVK